MAKSESALDDAIKATEEATEKAKSLCEEHPTKDDGAKKADDGAKKPAVEFPF